jgi:lipopolysaccharide transport system permease protein
VNKIANQNEPGSASTLAMPIIERPITIIRPSGGRITLDLRELWEYRDLLYLFAWRDIKVRYKQTMVGASWAIIQPFIAMVVLTIFFGKLARVPSEGIPYPIFAYSALVPWTYFVNVLTQSSNSDISSALKNNHSFFMRMEEGGRLWNIEIGFSY